MMSRTQPTDTEGFRILELDLFNHRLGLSDQVFLGRRLLGWLSGLPDSQEAAQRQIAIRKWWNSN